MIIFIVSGNPGAGYAILQLSFEQTYKVNLWVKFEKTFQGRCSTLLSTSDNKIKFAIDVVF